MKKKFYLVAVMILAALVIVSCSPENLQDGKTPATKKAMTSSEYSENSRAIKSVSVVEAYTIANSEKAASTTKSTSEGEYRLTFDGSEKISSSDIITQLKDKASKAKSEEEKAFYEKIASALPKDYSVEIKAGSYVEFKKDANNVEVVSSLDITIIIDVDKTIEIEKDADDKWIEIDGTFFDNSELEKMLEKAEEAAESIEEFFTNIKISLDQLKSIAKGTLVDIKEGDFGKEANATGSYSFSFDEGVFKASFDYLYQEEDDEEKISVNGYITFNFDSLNNVFSALFEITSEEGFEKFIESAKNTMDVKITVNGTEIWKDAFIDELM